MSCSCPRHMVELVVSAMNWQSRGRGFKNWFYRFLLHQHPLRNSAVGEKKWRRGRGLNESAEAIKMKLLTSHTNGILRASQWGCYSPSFSPASPSPPPSPSLLLPSPPTTPLLPPSSSSSSFSPHSTLLPLLFLHVMQMYSQYNKPTRHVLCAGAEDRLKTDT